MTDNLEDRFLGCLLGLAVGDALGAPFEGRSPDWIARRHRNAASLVHGLSPETLWYTDDTQMAIGVAETLIQSRRIEENVLFQRFAQNYSPDRGYGRGARLVLNALVKGDDHRSITANQFLGGSFGNGAAMRVAPVGLFFRDDHDALWEQARLSALPTHVHPLGIEGAQLIALAVGLASSASSFDGESFFECLIARCTSLAYSGPLRRAARLTDGRDLGLFGNGIEATASVVTAIASFVRTPESYVETVGNVILLGGDTDTLAAMAGAISGAYLGLSAIPTRWLDQLEDHRQGQSYLKQLALDLFAEYDKRLSTRVESDSG